MFFLKCKSLLDPFYQEGRREIPLAPFFKGGRKSYVVISSEVERSVRGKYRFLGKLEMTFLSFFEIRLRVIFFGELSA